MCNTIIIPEWLEVGVWGTVCNNYNYSWSLSTARVVCRQLGYSDALAALVDNPFDMVPISPVWLNLNDAGSLCNGTEAALQVRLLHLT